MEYQATLDTTAKVITALVAALFFTITVFIIRGLIAESADGEVIAINMLIVFFLLSVFAFCFLFRTTRYVVEGEKIIIRRPIKDVVIPLEKVKDVFVATKESMKWTIRTFGNGGLFGYYGKFRNSLYGNMTWYATRSNNFVMIITTSDKKIVLTPDDVSIVDEILSRLKRKHFNEE